MFLSCSQQMLCVCATGRETQDKRIKEHTEICGILFHVCVCLLHVTHVLLLKWSLRARVTELTGCSHTLRQTHTNTKTHTTGFLGSSPASSLRGEERKGVLAFRRCQPSGSLDEMENEIGTQEDIRR